MACAQRNVYIDAGVNWCNTLDLYRYIPDIRDNRSREAWVVYGFEASPLITPYAERCMHALNRGDALPMPPLPPAGSTKELQKFGSQLGCSYEDLNMSAASLQHRRRYKDYALKTCVERKLERQLRQLRPDPRLSSNEVMLQRRLRRGRDLPLSPPPGR